MPRILDQSHHLDTETKFEIKYGTVIVSKVAADIYVGVDPPEPICMNIGSALVTAHSPDGQIIEHNQYEYVYGRIGLHLDWKLGSDSYRDIISDLFLPFHFETLEVPVSGEDENNEEDNVEEEEGENEDTFVRRCKYKRLGLINDIPGGENEDNKAEIREGFYGFMIHENKAVIGWFTMPMVERLKHYSLYRYKDQSAINELHSDILKSIPTSPDVPDGANPSPIWGFKYGENNGWIVGSAFGATYSHVLIETGPIKVLGFMDSSYSNGSKPHLTLFCFAKKEKIVIYDHHSGSTRSSPHDMCFWFQYPPILDKGPIVSESDIEGYFSLKGTPLADPNGNISLSSLMFGYYKDYDWDYSFEVPPKRCIKNDCCIKEVHSVFLEIKEYWHHHRGVTEYWMNLDMMVCLDPDYGAYVTSPNLAILTLAQENVIIGDIIARIIEDLANPHCFRIYYNWDISELVSRIDRTKPIEIIIKDLRYVKCCRKIVFDKPTLNSRCIDIDLYADESCITKNVYFAGNNCPTYPHIKQFNVLKTRDEITVNVTLVGTGWIRVYLKNMGTSELIIDAGPGEGRECISAASGVYKIPESLKPLSNVCFDVQVFCCTHDNLPLPHETTICVNLSDDGEQDVIFPDPEPPAPGPDPNDQNCDPAPVITGTGLVYLNGRILASFTSDKTIARTFGGEYAVKRNGIIVARGMMNTIISNASPCGNKIDAISMDAVNLVVGGLYEICATLYPVACCNNPNVLSNAASVCRNIFIAVDHPDPVPPIPDPNPPPEPIPGIDEFIPEWLPRPPIPWPMPRPPLPGPMPRPPVPNPNIPGGGGGGGGGIHGDNVQVQDDGWMVPNGCVKVVLGNKRRYVAVKSRGQSWMSVVIPTTFAAPAIMNELPGNIKIDILEKGGILGYRNGVIYTDVNNGVRIRSNVAGSFSVQTPDNETYVNIETLSNAKRQLLINQETISPWLEAKAGNVMVGNNQVAGRVVGYKSSFNTSIVEGRGVNGLVISPSRFLIRSKSYPINNFPVNRFGGFIWQIRRGTPENIGVMQCNLNPFPQERALQEISIDLGVSYYPYNIFHPPLSFTHSPIIYTWGTMVGDRIIDVWTYLQNMNIDFKAKISFYHCDYYI